MGDGRVSDGGGDGESRLCLALNPAHRRRRDGNLCLGHIAGDFRLDYNGLTLILNRLLDQFIAVRSAHDGFCRAVLNRRPRRSVVCACGRGSVGACRWRAACAAVAVVRAVAAGRGCSRSNGHINLELHHVVVSGVIRRENHILLRCSHTRLDAAILPGKFS